MNILEAAKAMDEGKAVLCPLGYKHRSVDNIIVLGEYGEEPATMYLDDLLSADWCLEGE